MKKTILITGANRGIGLEIANQLLEQGHEVLLGSRDTAKGQEAVKKLNSPLASMLKLDVGNLESINSAFNEVKQEFDRLDVLVNNAGILPDSGYGLEDVPIEMFNDTMNVNFFGAFHMIRKFLPLLRKSSDARIINLSSGLGALNEMGSGYPGYRVSKAAINAMTAILGSELRHENIKVNSMCPGWVRTDMGGPGASRSVQKGAETAVWLATAADIPSGKFFRDKKVIDW